MIEIMICNGTNTFRIFCYPRFNFRTSKGNGRIKQPSKKTTQIDLKNNKSDGKTTNLFRAHNFILRF